VKLNSDVGQNIMARSERKRKWFNMFLKLYCAMWLRKHKI